VWCLIGTDRDQRAEEILDAKPNELSARTRNQCQKPVHNVRIFGNEECADFIGNRECDRSTRTTPIDAVPPERKGTISCKRAKTLLCLAHAVEVQCPCGGEISTLQRLDLRAECNLSLAS
jgi:hypothetical protein